MKKVKISGDTESAKFKSVEKILQSFQRRLRTRVTTIIPPAPMFSYVQQPTEDGTVLSCVFPVDGKVTKGVLAIGKYNSKEAVGFTVRVYNKLGGNEIKFITKKQVHLLDMGLAVAPGDIMSLTVDNPKTNDQWVVENIMACVLYEINMSDARIERRMIDNLLALEEEDEGI